MISALITEVAVLFFGAATSATAEGGGPVQPTLVVDLFSLEWWQSLLALAGLAGLSPLPWIGGLAVGRIGFTKVIEAQHQREIDAINLAHAGAIASLNQYHADVVAGKDQRYADLDAANRANIAATEVQRQRADEMTKALSQSTEAILATNYILNEFKQAAAEVTDEP